MALGRGDCYATDATNCVTLGDDTLYWQAKYFKKILYILLATSNSVKRCTV